MTIRWRIWYKDGSHFDNKMGTPSDAPRVGVEFIRYRNEKHNVLMCQGADYYLLERGSNDWYELKTIFDLALWVLFQLDRIEVVLAGLSMYTPEFEALRQRVMNDPDFPQRAGGKSALER